MPDSASTHGGSVRRHRPSLDREVYRTLADFRYLIRRFLEFSQTAAHAAKLTSRHHQALLAIKGFPGEIPPTIGDLAARLCIQHHSAVELIDRLAAAGLIERSHDPQDRRRVLLSLTQTAERRLAELSAVHLDELHRLRPALIELLDRVGANRAEAEDENNHAAVDP